MNKEGDVGIQGHSQYIHNQDTIVAIDITSIQELHEDIMLLGEASMVLGNTRLH